MKRLVSIALVASTSLPLAGQNLLGVDFDFGRVWRVDLQARTATQLGPIVALSHHALAMDSAGSFWSAVSVGGYHGLATVHPTDGTTTVVFAPTSEFRGLAADGASLLGIRLAPANITTELVRIDLTTGAETLIGPTGLTQLTSLTMHNGTCYAWDVTLGLVTLDLATGIATDVNASIGDPIGFGTAPIQFLASMPDGRLLGGRRFIFVINPQNGAAVTIIPALATELRGAELLHTSFTPRPPRICAGAFGPMRVSVTGVSSTLTTSSSPCTARVTGFLLIGASRTTSPAGPLPIPLGALGSNCLLNVSPDIVVQASASSASPASLTFNVPIPSAISRVQVYIQHAALEPVAGGIATTASVPVLLRP